MGLSNFLHIHRNFSAGSIFLLLIYVSFSMSLGAQSVKELEVQRKKTLQQLEVTNKMLNETKKSQKTSVNKINLIGKNINERKKLITTMTSQIGALDEEMVRLTNERNKMVQKLGVLKADYVRFVREAHLNRSMSAKIMFVLSAKTFDQSFRRLRYLQEFSDYRKRQVKKIEVLKTDIEHKNDSLAVNKQTKVQVVKEKETEASKLTLDQKKEKTYLSQLNKKEAKLRSDLKIQQKKAADLNNKIERIIAEQIRKEEAKRQAEAAKRQAAANKKQTTENNKTSKSSKETTSTKTTSASSQSVSTLTKEEAIISGNFSANRGRLPWPTDRGVITGHFGVHEHPVLKHVTTNNKGIYIQTPAGTNARAVFEGTVTQVGYFPGANTLVIIQHGDYRTVYANLTSVYVKSGDKVSAKQSIGKIYTDGENDNKTELYFQIWKGKTLQNPESWVAR
jgi:murein hydrolase activator